MKADKKTKQILASMLRENTGRSILDSGGTPKYDNNGKYIGSEDGYGRSYERNQTRDFDKEQPVSLKFSKYGDSLEIDITANLYHWLAERLEYDEKTDKLFREFSTIEGNEDKAWHELVDEFPNYLADLKGISHKEIGGGPYGEGDPSSFYTYNSQNVLSQDIIVSDFVIDGEAYVLLQVHGGCDARSGFSTPRVFRPNEPESLYMFADASISCPNGHGWYTDDAYHWYPNNGEGKLESYRAISDEEIADDEVYQEALRQLEEAKAYKSGKQALMEGFPPPDPKIGLLVIHDDGTADCPICSEKLEGWA